ncbi:hypothetical protein HK098_004967 [Nowakowskiella sp. JEL0407]|nr:hypothetical protein HK098_004967 [Nowakowskiella sp. JEL0407]
MGDIHKRSLILVIFYLSLFSAFAFAEPAPTPFFEGLKHAVGRRQLCSSYISSLDTYTYVACTTSPPRSPSPSPPPPPPVSPSPNPPQSPSPNPPPRSPSPNPPPVSPSPSPAAASPVAVVPVSPTTRRVITQTTIVRTMLVTAIPQTAQNGVITLVTTVIPIDVAVVTEITDLTVPTTSVSAEESNGGGGGLPIGSIIGVIAAVIGVFIVAGGYFYFRNVSQKNGRKRKSDAYAIDIQHETSFSGTIPYNNKTPQPPPVLPVAYYEQKYDEDVNPTRGVETYVQPIPVVAVYDGRPNNGVSSYKYGGNGSTYNNNNNTQNYDQYDNYDGGYNNNADYGDSRGQSTYGNDYYNANNPQNYNGGNDVQYHNSSGNQGQHGPSTNYGNDVQYQDASGTQGHGPSVYGGNDMQYHNPSNADGNYADQGYGNEQYKPSTYSTYAPNYNQPLGGNAPGLIGNPKKTREYR